MSFVGNGGPVRAPFDDLLVAPADPGSLTVQVGQVVPGGHQSATNAALGLIEGAARRVDIVNPYLTDGAAIEHLVDAAQRGVVVRVIVSERSNNALASAALRHHYAGLIGAGVEIWEYPRAVVHAGVIVADDAVQLGTLNLDAWAMYRNFELALVAEDADVTDRFERALVRPAVDRSTPGRPTRSPLQRSVNRAANVLSPLL